MSNQLTFQKKSLMQQGYQCYTPRELSELEWGLRFTPAACTALTVVALIMQWPTLAFIVSALGIWAFFFPAAHPMDLIYNHLIAPMLGATKLPPNPLQRRMACLSAGILNFTIGVLFLSGQILGAYLIGALLVTLQLIVITSHFCVLSWMYEGVMRLLGRWQVPLTVDEAKRLLKNGAQLVDVRSEVEFAKAHLQGAINIPVDNIEQHAEEFSGKPILVCCASGMRSQIAQHKLQQVGAKEIYDLGAFDKLSDYLPIEQ